MRGLGQADWPKTDLFSFMGTGCQPTYKEVPVWKLIGSLSKT